MFAPNVPRYLRLETFSPGVRTWIRLWLDGLHSGSHVHWQLSPISVVALAKLRPFFQPLKTWPSHLEAMTRMAIRRRGLKQYFGDMPTTTNVERWNAFFEHQLGHEDHNFKPLIDWHRSWVESGDTTAPALEALWLQLNELAAALLPRGYSTDDLFNRVKDGVIDVKNIKGRTAEERLFGFFDYFISAEPRTFWAWTIVLSTSPLSGTQLKSFSNIRLENVWDLTEEQAESQREQHGPAEHLSNSTRVLLRRDEQLTPAIVTKVGGGGTGVVKERHRTEALRHLKSVKKLGKLYLSSETQIVLADDVTRKPWRYSRKSYALPMLGPHVPDVGTGLVTGAAQDLFDNPGGVILEVFSEIQRLGTDDWWTTSQDYHHLLRKDLGFAIRAFRERVRGNFESVQAAEIPPAVLILGDVEGIRDYSHLARILRSVPAYEDFAFLFRLDEVRTWPHFNPTFPLHRHAYNTAHEIPELLNLARGFRNALTHKFEIPFRLHTIAVYLGAVLLHVYSARIRRLAK